MRPRALHPVEALFAAQRHVQRLINVDLLHGAAHGTKQHHWLWYVCPTCKVGVSDARRVRIVTTVDAHDAVAWHFDLAWWAGVLDFLSHNAAPFLADPRDAGRLHHFHIEWTRHLARWPHGRVKPPHYTAFAAAVRRIGRGEPRLPQHSRRACSTR